MPHRPAMLNPSTESQENTTLGLFSFTNHMAKSAIFASVITQVIINFPIHQEDTLQFTSFSAYCHCVIQIFIDPYASTQGMAIGGYTAQAIIIWMQKYIIPSNTKTVK